MIWGAQVDKGERPPPLVTGWWWGRGQNCWSDNDRGRYSHWCQCSSGQICSANSVVVGVPGQNVSRSKPHNSNDIPDLNHTSLPDLVGVSLSELMLRVEVFEKQLNGQESLTLTSIYPIMAPGKEKISRSNLIRPASSRISGRSAPSPGKNRLYSPLCYRNYPTKDSSLPRHLLIPDVGLQGQRKLKAASILIIGTAALVHRLPCTWQLPGSATSDWSITMWSTATSSARSSMVHPPWVCLNLNQPATAFSIKS